MTPLKFGSDLARQVGGLIFPMFARKRDVASLKPATLFGLRAATLTGMLGSLFLVNSRFHLFIKEHWQGLDRIWLPLVFLLVYVLLWLVRWYWSQLGPDRQETAFPDIDEAWREVMQSLARAGLSLDEYPLFLVLGRTQDSEEVLFDAAGLHLKLRGQPNRGDAPVRVYAGRDAIYLTCAGASVLGQYRAAQEDPDFVKADPTALTSAPGDSVYPGGFMTLSDVQTLGPWQSPTEKAPDILARAQQAGRGPDQLKEEELRALGRLAAEEKSRESDMGRASSKTNPARDRAEAEVQGARLRHLGQLISRERRPYCPINGILLLVPIAATNSDHAATRVGLLCQRDLAMVHRSMPVRCPVFALVCDLETLPGFRELIQRLPDDQRRRRMGQRFPLIPDVDPIGLPGIFEGGINWIASKQFPAQVDQLWRVESVGESSTVEAVAGNVQLYRFLRQIRERHRRLGRVLSRAMITDGVPTSMLGGCYLAGTGGDARTEQAFIPGVFRRLIESQDLVSWTPELLLQESRYRRWARQGYIILGLAAIIYLGLLAAFYVYKGPESSPTTTPKLVSTRSLTVEAIR